MGSNLIRVLGIDPGLETTGIGILDINGNRYIPVYCGCIITKSNLQTHERLKKIYETLEEIIIQYHPGCIAIEKIFFSANVKTALAIGQSRGVLLLAGSKKNLKIYEYTPLQVKQAIVGYGRATKKQIKYMVRIILGAKEEFFPKQDDAWDAMGIALCHASMSRFREKVDSHLK